MAESDRIQGAVTLKTPMEIVLEKDNVILKMGNAKLTIRGLEFEEINIIKRFAEDCYEVGYADASFHFLNLKNNNYESNPII